jgi:hypothetical protein
MKRVFFCLLSLTAILVSGGPAHAQLSVVRSKPVSNCPITETAQVNISFNYRETDLHNIKSTMDKKTADIQALAQKAGVQTLEVQSSNYSANTYNSGCSNRTLEEAGSDSNAKPTAPGQQYQVNGNLSFNVIPGNKAPDLMALLAEKGYTVSFSVNSYRRCQ